MVRRVVIPGALLLTLLVVVRASLPRLRPDQAIRWCWGVVLPLSMLHLFATAVLATFLGSGVGP